MQIHTGLGSGLTVGWPGSTGTNANASPQGPATAASQGFGVQSPGQNKWSPHALGVMTVGTLALVGLAALWWALPR